MSYFVYIANEPQRLEKTYIGTSIDRDSVRFAIIVNRDSFAVSEGLRTDKFFGLNYWSAEKQIVYFKSKKCFTCL